MQYALIPAAILAVGWGVWIRRPVWKFPWERLLTLSLVLQGLGFVLIAPGTPEYRVGAVLLEVTGVAHLRDFFGDTCFLGALCCVIYAVAHRLVPDNEMPRQMRRVELPCGAAAFGMLITLSVSRSVRSLGSADFFRVVPDGWLVAYWSIYGAVLVYLIGYLAWLLLILRQDPRSRLPADMYLVACGLGLSGVLIRAIAMSDPALNIPPRAIWAPICLSCIAAVGAATVSAWRKRRWLTPPKARIEPVPEVIVTRPPPRSATFG